jgi:glycerate kinase
MTQNQKKFLTLQNLKPETRNVLIAPDKFKGSLTSRQVCDIVADTLKSCFPEINITSLPLADGGEGSCELLTSFFGGTMVEIDVHDPLFRKIKASYGLSPDRSTAFIEMAAASGLQLLKQNERNPLKTSTFGTGELIRHALDSGVSKIILGIGGSATNDGGMGMAHALGLNAYAASGESLMPAGENLIQIDRIDSTRLHPRLQMVNVTVLCDVDNPLYGSNGAAFVFAPQKGATPYDVMKLDEGLRHLEKKLNNTFKATVDFPGAGAGGGFAAALSVITKSNVTSGMKFITGITNLERKIASADVVITGEGQLDKQTLSGKVVRGVAALALQYHKPVIGIAGQCTLTKEELKTLGISKVITLVGGDISEDEAIRQAGTVLAGRVRENAPDLLKINFLGGD